MLKRWVAAMLVVFLAVNGLVVAGDSTIHASHDTQACRCTPTVILKTFQLLFRWTPTMAVIMIVTTPLATRL